MEVLIGYKGLSTKLLGEIETLNSVLGDLNLLFNKSAVSIWRQDQIDAIKALRLRISEEIKNEQLAEEGSKYSFTKAKLLTGAAGFVLGGLIGLAQKSENPVSLGAKILKQQLNKQESFGALAIALKDGSGLGGVEVAAISRLAREANMPESKVYSSLKAKGFVLLLPKQFWKVLEVLEKKVLEGIIKFQTPLHKCLFSEANNLTAPVSKNFTNSNKHE